MSIHSSGTQLAPTRSVSPQHRSQELLADIPTAGAGAKPVIVFSRHAPASLWDRFVGWLTRPIQRMHAKTRVKEILKEKDIHASRFSKLPSVVSLHSELAASSALRGISLKVARDAFIDLMISGKDLGDEFRPWFDEHLDQIKSHYNKMIADHFSANPIPATELKARVTEELKGLEILLAFAKNPTCALSISDNHSARAFIDQYAGSDTYGNQLLSLFERYSVSYREHQRNNVHGRIVELSGKFLQTPLQKKEFDSAMASMIRQLRQAFRPSEHDRISSLENYIAGDIDLAIRENRQSLRAFLSAAAEHYLKFDRATQDCLRPLMVSIEDDLLVATSAPSNQAVADEASSACWAATNIRDPGRKKLVTTLEINVDHKDNFSPACSLALIEYLVVKDKIQALENESRILEDKIRSAKADIGTQLKTQLRKKMRVDIKRSSTTRYIPRGKIKTKVIKNVTSVQNLAQTLSINTTNIVSLKQQLVNPESLIRLAHVHASEKAFLRSLPSSERAIASDMLETLFEDLKTYMLARLPNTSEGPTRINPGAQASLRPGLVTSSRSDQN